MSLSVDKLREMGLLTGCQGKEMHDTCHRCWLATAEAAVRRAAQEANWLDTHYAGISDSILAAFGLGPDEKERT